MMPSTCVIRSKEEFVNCPLCSNGILKQGKLLRELEEIERQYLGKVHTDAIARMQYQHYVASYKDPLERNGRDYVDMSLSDIRNHFNCHRISHDRLILDDVGQVREAQRLLISHSDYDDNQLSDSKLKTWMQLSKHKHELLRMLKCSELEPAKQYKLNTV